MSNEEWSGKGILSKENMERALRESNEVQMKVFNQNWMTRLLYKYALYLGKDKS